MGGSSYYGCLCGGRAGLVTPLKGGEPSPKGLPWAGTSRMLDAAREARRLWSGGREGGNERAYSPLLSYCGRKEGTLGSPAGWKTGRAGGGYRCNSSLKWCVAAVGPPLCLLAQRMSPGLWEHCPSWRSGHYGVKISKRTLLDTCRSSLWKRLIVSIKPMASS